MSNETRATANPDPNTTNLFIETSWIDTLKGIAIIGVFYENWINYMELATTPALLYSLAKGFTHVAGPLVQVFIILSGFGLTLSYLKASKINWSWKRWAWRRITKIVLPYEIIVILSFIMAILGKYLYKSIDEQFSWYSLLAYLTFTRNFYPPSWTWNPSLWFMPVIIGLYVCFPILVGILEKWGSRALLLISVLVTYGTLIIAVLAGIAEGHNSALFTFWLFQFSLGMILAYKSEKNQYRLRFLIDPRALLLGVGLVICSWIIKSYVHLGTLFNDSMTCIGVFLILLNLEKIVRMRVPIVSKALNVLSSKSYLMYLIHYPVMKFIVGPPLNGPFNPMLVMILGGIYILVIFFLCNYISKPINTLTSMLYKFSFKQSLRSDNLADIYPGHDRRNLRQR